MAAAKKPKPQRGVKTRAGGTLTEAQFWQRIRNKGRQLWLHWPVRTHVLNNNRIVVTPKRGRRHKFEYQCAHCEFYFPNKEVEVDHIIPAGSISADAHAWFERLLCEADNLQVLCKPCHRIKTAEDRKKQ
mgnify:CR=1 FL=1